MSESTHLGRLSSVLAHIAFGLMIALPLLTVLVWVRFDVFGPDIASRVVKGWCNGGVPLELTRIQTLLGIGAMMLPAAAVMWGLTHLRRLLSAFAMGQVFTIESVTALRRFAWCVAAAIVLDVISGAMISVILTMNNPPGQRELAIGLSSDQVLTVFFGAVFALIARVMEVGRRLAAENAEFL